MDQTSPGHKTSAEVKGLRDQLGTFSPRETFARMPSPPNKSFIGVQGQSGDVDENYLSDTIGGKHGVEISLHNQAAPIDWTKITLPPKTDLHKLLHYKITNYIDPDILIQIGNHEYRCHLLVLQSYSGYFVDNAVPRLELSEKNVSKTAFILIYDWMLHHGGDSFKLLRRDNILDIHMAATFLRIEELVSQCEAFIDCEDLFSEDRAFNLYLDARALGNTSIMMEMVPRIQKFFLTLVASKEFLELSADEVCIFLHSSFICIHCEMEVFMAAVRWLMWDWEGRQQYVAELMSYVRFGLIAPWQLVDIRRNPRNQEFLLVSQDPRVARMIEDGLAFAIVQNGQESSNPDQMIETFGLQTPAPRNWARSDRVTEQKKYNTYQEFLASLSKYRKIHVFANKGEGDKVRASSESLQTDVGHARQLIKLPDMTTQRSRS